MRYHRSRERDRGGERERERQREGERERERGGRERETWTEREREKEGMIQCFMKKKDKGLIDVGNVVTDLRHQDKTMKYAAIEITDRIISAMDKDKIPLNLPRPIESF